MAYINNNKVLFSAKITGGGSLIEVTTLPTTNIDKTAFYRTPDGIYWYDNGWKEIIDDVSLDAILSDKGYLTQHQDISGKQDKLTFDGTYNASTNKAATVKTVATEVAKMLAGADADFDTLKEMSDWLTEHKDSAATMNSAIADKLNKNETPNRLYGVDSTGNQEMVEYGSESSTTNLRSIVLRNMGGGITIKDADIKTDTDAVNRKYVKNAVAPKSCLTLASDEEDGVSLNVENSTQSKDEGELYFNTPNGSSVRLTNIATPKLAKDAVNKKYVDDALANVGGSGGGSAAIIDVDALPTENINANAFYRVREEALGYCTFFNGEKNNIDGLPVVLHTVDTLPEVGEPYMDSMEAPTQFTCYFLTSESMMYVFLPAEMSGGDSDMWFAATQMNIQFTVVTSPEEATEENILYIVPCTSGYKYTLYEYANGEWIEFKTDFSEFAKKEDIHIPTKVSEFENDAGYLIAGEIIIDYSSATADEINNAITAYKEGKRVFIKVSGEAYLPEVQSILSQHSEMLVAQYYSRASTFETLGDITFNEIRIGVYYDSVMKSHTKSNLANVFATKTALDEAVANAGSGGGIFEPKLMSEVKTDAISSFGWNDSLIRAYGNGDYPPFKRIKTDDLECDMTWNGDITTGSVVDLSSFGFPGATAKKISSNVYSNDQLIGSEYIWYDKDYQSEFMHRIESSELNELAPGLVVVNNSFIVISDQTSANTALGLPTGYLTNGTYFIYSSKAEGYCSALYTVKSTDTTSGSSSGGGKLYRHFLRIEATTTQSNKTYSLNHNCCIYNRNSTSDDLTQYSILLTNNSGMLYPGETIVLSDDGSNVSVLPVISMTVNFASYTIDMLVYNQGATQPTEFLTFSIADARFRDDIKEI